MAAVVHPAPLPNSPPPSDDDDDPAFSANTPPDAFLLSSSQLTRDYVASNIAHPSRTLSTASARSAFLVAVFGDPSLATHADADPPLLRQLQSRCLVLISHVSPLLSSALINPSPNPAAPSHHVVDALIALYALVAARWPVLIPTLDKRYAVLAIINIMRAFAHNPQIVARSMTALRVLAVTDSVRKRIMVDGGLTLTLELMQRYPTDHRVQLRAPAVIANVAFGCTHRKRRIARQGGLRAIVQAMATFPNDEDIQLRAALTIRNLTHEAQVNQYIAGNEGAVEAIATALLRFRGNSTKPELRFHCVMALESLCREHQQNRQRVIDIDGCATPRLSKSYSIDSVPAPRQPPDDVAEFINEDGDVIVDEEEVLLSHASANFRHGGALFPGRPSKRIGTSASISSSTCSDKVVPKSPQGPMDAAVAADAAEDMALDESGTALSDVDNRPSLLRSIVHAIRREPDDELLVETALSLLTLISMQRGEVQIRIGEVGGMQVAIAAMRRHAKNSIVVARACALIRGLCFEDVNRGLVTSGLVALIESARDHRRDAQTGREIVSALSNAVFEHEKNRAWVVNKGGMEAVVKVMEEVGERDVMVLEAGMCALRNFVDRTESGALCASNEGGIRVTVGAMDQTKGAKSVSERFVQEQCVLFLVEVARLAPRTKEEMVETEAGDWVENALAKLDGEEYAELHEVGDKLLVSLVETDRKRKLSDARTARQREGMGNTPGMGGRTMSRSLFGAFGWVRRGRPRTGVGWRDGDKVGGRISGVSDCRDRRNSRMSTKFRRNSGVS